MPAQEYQASKNGARAFAEKIESQANIEAIFFANDVLDAGGMFEARCRGIHVPDDIGIAGFDDIDLAGQLSPSLTTVRVPRYEIGARAAQLLLDRINGNP